MYLRNFTNIHEVADCDHTHSQTAYYSNREYHLYVTGEHYEYYCDEIQKTSKEQTWLPTNYI